MALERFVASRFTRGNLFFPTVLEVTEAAVVRRKRCLFRNNEMSIHLKRVASVHVETGLFFADVLIESSGGTDPIASHGHRKGDARRIQELIEKAQTELMPGLVDPGPTKVCPFCAETIKEAARVCRFCGRELATSR